MLIPRVGLSLMLEDDYLAASYPLFEAGLVDVLEWSFDTGWGDPGVPAWADALLDEYSGAGRLLGHGVSFSPLSAQWTTREDIWLAHFEEECKRRNYLHISEHFGFCAAGSFHHSAPLPVPRTPEALRVGRERLRRLAEVAGRPVGLENLAFAFSSTDVSAQGPFLNDLLEPVGGFLLLDLHNVTCQMLNFRVAGEQLLDSYPLDRVRELHVSGGSWFESQADPTAAPVRRDTHDGAVPEELWQLLPVALVRCPNVHAVIFEQLGDTLASPESQHQFRNDFCRLRQVVGASLVA